MDLHLPFERPGSDIKKEGYLKKIKTMKRKYFVLRSTSSSGPARLEYYDNEKKFRNLQPPKRSILLHTCFNINRKSDSKHRFAVALYTHDDCFSVQADTEAERDDWLSLLLKFQHEYLAQGDEARREHYDYVWQVTVQTKGLGGVKGIKGPLRLCLSSHSLSLYRVGQEKPLYSFQLATVRSVAHNDCVFKLEVGSWAPTGEGEIWMQVEDSTVAQNMHEAILQRMKSPQLDLVDDEAKKTERFEMRTGSCSIGPSGLSRELRPRTLSESHTNSPMRLRQQEPPRPVSYSIRSSSLPAPDLPSPGTSPHSHLLMDPFFDRMRSDSVGSRSSRASYSIGAEDHFDSFQPPLSTPCEGHSSIDEEDNNQDYSMMNRDTASNLSSPGDLTDGGSQASAYMEMGPGGATTPVGGPPPPPPPPAAATAGYVDMTLSQRQDSGEHGSLTPAAGPDPYMLMRPSSSPIPIHPAVREQPGYMEMTHSTHSSHGSHLPTVQEGGSSDGYLPMTPSFSQSPRSNSFNLRPERAVCMLSDDSGEFHQRTLSLGSRPLTKVRVFPMAEGSKKGGQLDTGRSCSAPHLMASKPRGLVVDSPTPSASPLSLSLKSDDLDSSFMQMEFSNRPRTGSDSYSSRPRASSFGARANQPGHRPRSSSHGQSMRPLKLKLNTLKASSQEYIGKNSIDSLGRMSRDSLRMSSSESLRRQDEARYRASLGSDYIDMSGDKRKTPSPLPPGHLPPSDPNGYMDMTLGSSRSSSPHHARHPHSQASSIGSSERIDSQGYTSMELPRPSSSSSSGSTYMSAEAGDQGGKGSGKHSRSSSAENVDSYVMYEPSTSSGKGSSSHGPGSGGSHYSSAGHLTGQPQHGSMGHVSGGYVTAHGPMWSGSYGSGSLYSTGSRDDGHHRASQESVGSRSSGSRHSPKRRGSRDSGKGEQAPVRVVQIGPSASSSVDGTRERRRTPPGRPVPKGETDEYIEFSPLTAKSTSSDSGSVGSSGSEHQHPSVSSSTVLQPESQYVEFQPGQVGSQAPSVSSSSSVRVMRSSGGAFAAPPASSSSSAKPSAPPAKSSEKEREAQEKLSKEKKKKEKQKGGDGGAAKKAGEKEAAGGDYFNLSFGQKPEVGAGSRAEPGKKRSLFSKAFTPEALARPLESMYKRDWQGEEGAYYQHRRGPAGPQPQPQHHQQQQPPPQPQPQQPQPQPSQAPQQAPRSSPRSVEVSAGTQARTRAQQTVLSSEQQQPQQQQQPKLGSASATVVPSSSPASSSPRTTLAPPASRDASKRSGAEARVQESSVPSPKLSPSPRASPTPTAASTPSPTPAPSQGKSGGSQGSSGGESGSGGSSSGRGLGIIPKPGLPNFAQKLGKALGAGVGGGNSSKSGSGGSGGGGGGEKTGGTLAHPDSMPCMLGMDRPQGQTLTVDSTPRSRHSIADSSGYEQMSFPSSTTLAAKPSSSSQPVTPLPSSPCTQKTLNYADLDLGSAESVGDGESGVRTPRSKSRHASAAEERPGTSSYAEIDFEKSETLKNANNKDVKFTL